jgi:hypothetical protein
MHGSSAIVLWLWIVCRRDLPFKELYQIVKLLSRKHKFSICAILHLSTACKWPIHSRAILCCLVIHLFSHAALDLEFFSIDDFTAINFEPLAELKIQKDSMKSKTHFRNRQALQQALINEANIDADLLEDLHKFFWSGDSNEDSRLTLAEFKKLIDVNHIDMDETHVHALVSSLFKVSD